MLSLKNNSLKSSTVLTASLSNFIFCIKKSNAHLLNESRVSLLS